MDLQIQMEHSHLISPHLRGYCDNVEPHLYANEADLKLWTSGKYWVSGIMSFHITFWLLSGNKNRKREREREREILFLFVCLRNRFTIGKGNNVNTSLQNKKANVLNGYVGN